jgi:hypothetical protein
MYGGGVDRDVPDHLDTDVLTIPSHDRESYLEKMHPILTAKAVLVLEKDTLFNEIIHTSFFQSYKDHFLVITVTFPSTISLQHVGKRLSRFCHEEIPQDGQRAEPDTLLLHR